MDKSYSRYNVVATYGSGKIGNARLYKKGDRNYVRAAYNGAITNPRTEFQMRNRLKWANLGVAWQYLKPHLERGFEGQKPYRSAFNLWMKANMAESLGAYLEKERTEGKVCPIQPFILTKGSIVSNDTLTPLTPEWEYNTQEGFRYPIVEDIVCHKPTGTSPTAGTVFADMLAENSWLKEGDMLTFIEMSENSLSPRPEVTFTQCIIDPTDTNAFSPATYGFNYSSAATESPEPIEVNSFHSDDQVECVGVGVIVSRKENNILTTTTSQMAIDSFAQTKLAQFLTRTQFKKAAESYGATITVYLDPDKYNNL